MAEPLIRVERRTGRDLVHASDMVYQTCALTWGVRISRIAGLWSGAGCQQVLTGNRGRKR